MWRGIEVILQGRDPREAWAFTQRICGVCTTVHALASVRCVEDALGIRVPQNADLIRNIMFLAQMVQDHVIHFYHLHALDWVDVTSALNASASGTAALQKQISPAWQNSSMDDFAGVQATLKKFVDSGQLGIFQNAYWGHPAYKLPPEGNLLAVAHYLEALKWQKEIVKIHALFGGKNPHPNYMVGGMPCSIQLDGSAEYDMEGPKPIAVTLERLKSLRTFIQNAINLARGLETRLCACWLKNEYDQLIANVNRRVVKTADTTRWNPSTWPRSSKGSGFTEAPRGACGHWIQISGGKVSNYQIVVPSTWNASPKDGMEQRGAYESALLGTPMAVASQPLEILRTMHSFDPCLACATHVMSPDGRKLAEVKIV